MIRKWMITSVIMFVLANTLMILGLVRGRVWGANYLDPLKTPGILEREAVINSFTYVPVICGISLCIASLIIFAISLNHLLKKES